MNKNWTVGVGVAAALLGGGVGYYYGQQDENAHQAYFKQNEHDLCTEAGYHETELDAATQELYDSL
jgi:membrane protein DedA with SNARE-associated domain